MIPQRLADNAAIDSLRSVPQRLQERRMAGRSLLSRLRRTAFWRHQVRKRVAVVIRLLADWALFILVVVTAGLSTAYFMMDRGTNLSTVTAGPWTMWPAAARTDADPYTRAHFARLGALPLPADIAETWTATTDAGGDTLHSSCDYEVVVRPPPSSWWSLAVFDSSGRLIQNAAQRHVFTSETGAISPDGRFVALLSRSAGGTNWLPTGGAGSLSLVYTLIDMGIATGAGGETDDLAARVPEINAKGCR